MPFFDLIVDTAMVSFLFGQPMKVKFYS